ncbi:MAG: ATP-binding cassette domain-containing protein [Frankia sp.]
MTTTSPDARPAPAAVRNPRPDPPPAVDVTGLTKRYGRRTVLDGLHLRIPDGAVCGFVGPNGAGKTTTLRILLGLVRPSAGDGTVLGEPLNAPRRYLPRVGALIESPAFYPSLSGERNLAALAVLGGHDPALVPATLARVGLAERGDDQYRRYSLGMKQRLGIGAALLGDPDLLILDEPTNGLDPSGIRQMRDLLRSLAHADGPTVLVSSHLLAEMEQICDWLVVVERGRLAYSGPADGLMGNAAPTFLLRAERPDHLPLLGRLATDLGASVEADGARLRLRVADDVQAEDARTLVGELNREAHRLGITLVEIAPVRASLEERYSGLVEAGVLSSDLAGTGSSDMAATGTGAATTSAPRPEEGSR